MNKTLWVEAVEGRTVPLHPSVHTEGLGVHVLKPGERARVADGPLIRRSVRSGDLRVLDKDEVSKHETSVKTRDAEADAKRRTEHDAAQAAAKRALEDRGYPLASGIVKPAPKGDQS